MTEIIHQVFARYRFRHHFTLEKVGRVRYEMDPKTGLLVAARSLVKLMPVGGFDGLMMSLPLDQEPPPRPQPKRTPQLADDSEAMEDEELYNTLYSVNSAKDSR
jgi:hypothetical protein